MVRVRGSRSSLWKGSALRVTAGGAATGGRRRWPRTEGVRTLQVSEVGVRALPPSNLFQSAEKYGEQARWHDEEEEMTDWGSW